MIASNFFRRPHLVTRSCLMSLNGTSSPKSSILSSLPLKDSIAVFRFVRIDCATCAQLRASREL